MAEEKQRPDVTPVPPTRIARLKEAVRHLKEGGTMALANVDDLYNLLEQVEAGDLAAAKEAEDAAADAGTTSEDGKPS